jgi:hypothetical protein
MGTNYYVDWRPSFAGSVTINMHICKSLYMFQGEPFATWSEWKSFLLHNWETARITDENGRVWATTAFVAAVDEKIGSPSGRRQHEAAGEYGPIDPQRDWLDPDGFSFHRGEFC